MKENYISFLKDYAIISSLWSCFVVGLIVILILKFILKSTKIKPKVFDNLVLLAAIVFLILGVSIVLIAKNYSHLWHMIYVFIVIILLKVIPKFVKWYDGKIDKLGTKIGTTR